MMKLDVCFIKDESLITPMVLVRSIHHIEAGRGISAKTCGLDDVFPPDDIGSSLYTQFIIIYLQCSSSLYTQFIIIYLQCNIAAF